MSEENVPVSGPEATEYISRVNPANAPQPSAHDVEREFLKSDKGLGINRLVTRLNDLEARVAALEPVDDETDEELSLDD